MFIYVMAQNSPEPGAAYVKIGISSDPEGRRRQLQTGNPNHIDLIESFKVSGRYEAETVERLVHAFLKDCALSGEWFLCAVARAISTVEILVK